MNIHDLPALNASLNGLSTVFLLLGFWFIRRKRIAAHRRCMLSAVVTSCLFLISYLTYHFSAQAVTRFTAEGWVRPVYFAILISHIILAVVIVPLVLVTLVRALRERFDQHRRIARWTWPLWMYVSVTGVIIYVMLYHLYPPEG
jgi:uncharacterized membrane protein YozB (DUF420 family)